MEEITKLIGEVNGLDPRSIAVYSLDNEDSDSPDDYWFEDDNHFSGYYTNTLNERQYLFVIKPSGSYLETEVEI